MLHTLRFSLQNAVYFIMLPFLVPVFFPFLVPVFFTFYIKFKNLNVKFGCQKVNELKLCMRSASIRDKNRTILSAVGCIITDTKHIY
jgi:ABC-type sugar transport system permease subunit